MATVAREFALSEEDKFLTRESIRAFLAEQLRLLDQVPSERILGECYALGKVIKATCSINFRAKGFWCCRDTRVY